MVLKPKRRETTGAPSASDLAVGELAINLADQELYIKNSSGSIVKVGNYAEADPRLIFPSGDLGNLSQGTVDAFGQALSSEFDNLDTPYGSVSTQDLGSLS